MTLDFLHLPELRQTLKETEPDQGPSQVSITDRAEHTLAGTAFGLMRDAVTGLPRDKAEQLRRAEFNDEAARIAADVIVCLPTMKLHMAGVVRAAMLVDTKQPFPEMAGSLALNYGQGLALHGISKATAAEGAVGSWAKSQLGSGLPAEVATNTLSGAGYSFVRTGMDERTWSSGNGETPGGADRLLTATISGALINIPAGMAGVRFGRLAGLFAPEGTAARISSSIASSSAAGGVFGFTDSLVQTNSLVEATKGFAQGMFIGGITGGAVSKFAGMHDIPSPAPNARAHSNFEIPRTISTVEPAPNLVSRRATDASPMPMELRLSATAREGHDSSKVRLITGPEKYGTLERTLGPGKEFREYHEDIETLPRAQSGTYQSESLKHGAPSRFTDWAEFKQWITTTPKDADIYQVGSIKIIVPSDYNKSLNEVRVLRKAAFEKTAFDFSITDDWLRRQGTNVFQRLDNWLKQGDLFETIGDFNAHKKSNLGATLADILHPSLEPQLRSHSPRELREALPALRARMLLGHNGFQHRALPEHVIAAVRRTPDAGKFTEIYLLNENSVYDVGKRQLDPWVKKNYTDKGVDFESAGTANLSTNVIQLLKTERRTLVELLGHEQVHLNHNPLYPLARELDPRIEATKYGDMNDLESEAELESEMFLPRPTKLASLGLRKFFEAVDEAPLRMLVTARKLTATIEKAAPENRSLDQHEILARTQYVEKVAGPRAIELLTGLVREHPARESAVKLLVAVNRGLPTPAVRDALASVIIDGSRETSRVAADGLIQIGDSSAIDTLRPLVVQLQGDITVRALGRRTNAMRVMATLASGQDAGSAELYAGARGTLINWAQPTSDIRHAARQYLAERYGSEDGFAENQASDALLAHAPGMDLEAQLRYNLDSGDEYQKWLAAFKLRVYGDESDIPNLLAAASSNDLRLASTALSSALTLRNPDSSNYFTMLEPLMFSHSPVKRAARELVKFMPGEEAKPYQRTFQHIERTDREFDPKDAAQQLANLPHGADAGTWFDEIVQALDQASNLPGGVSKWQMKREFALSTIDKVPRLQDRGFQLLLSVVEQENLLQSRLIGNIDLAGTSVIRIPTGPNHTTTELSSNDQKRRFRSDLLYGSPQTFEAGSWPPQPARTSSFPKPQRYYIGSFNRAITQQVRSFLNPSGTRGALDKADG